MSQVRYDERATHDTAQTVAQGQVELVHVYEPFSLNPTARALVRSGA
jgi:hypothetical protein